MISGLVSRRRGVTILELLVVLLILLMVTAAAIPIVVPAMQNRQMRESARLVSSYFAIARSRAIETGRPVGVVVERFGGQPFGMVLSQVEVPPPYAGEDYGAVCPSVVAATIQSMSAVAYYMQHYQPAGISVEWFAATMDASFNPALVRVGDQIQLGGQGPVYTILGPDDVPMPNGDGVIDAGTPVTLDVAYLRRGTLTQRFPGDPGAGGPTPQPPTYQIIRQPTRSSTAPLQLPEGIVVDLTCSGMGAGGTFMAATSFGPPGVMTPSVPTSGPVVAYDAVIMFSPSGRLEAVSQGDLGRLARPTDAVYLLLGRRDLMFDATEKPPTDANATQNVVDQNLSPPSLTAVPANPATWPAPPPHFWVAIGYQTGLVTVAEVAANFQDYATPGTPLMDVITDALPDARLFARQSQSVGGR